jgi:hypothetical protein
MAAARQGSPDGAAPSLCVSALGPADLDGSLPRRCGLVGHEPGGARRASQRPTLPTHAHGGTQVDRAGSARIGLEQTSTLSRWMWLEIIRRPSGPISLLALGPATPQIARSGTAVTPVWWCARREIAAQQHLYPLLGGKPLVVYPLARRCRRMAPTALQITAWSNSLFHMTYRAALNPGQTGGPEVCRGTAS